MNALASRLQLPVYFQRQGLSRFIFGVFKFCIFPGYSAGLFYSAESSELFSPDGGFIRSALGFRISSLFVLKGSAANHCAIPEVSVRAQSLIFAHANTSFTGTLPCPFFVFILTCLGNHIIRRMN